MSGILQLSCNESAPRFLALLLVAILGADLPGVHVHDAGSASLYNEECPLARLAVPAWSLPALAAETPARAVSGLRAGIAPPRLQRACPACSPFSRSRPARDLLSPTAH